MHMASGGLELIDTNTCLQVVVCASYREKTSKMSRQQSIKNRVETNTQREADGFNRWSSVDRAKRKR